VKANKLALFLALLGAGAAAFFTGRKGYQDVDAKQALELTRTPGVLLLDVRTPEEFAQGRIEGAKLIPISELQERLSELGDRKDAPVLVYCLSGSRSAIASTLLHKEGWTQVHNLQGRLRAWVAARQPLAR